MTSTTKQGQWVVVRDKDGRVVSKVMQGGTTKETFRSLVRKMTNDGIDIITTMYDIMKGTPFVAKLPDGRETEPMVPTPDTRRQAAQFMWEQVHGRAVPQTEVLEATKADEDLTRYQAMTEEQLEKELAESKFLEARLARGEDESG